MTDLSVSFQNELNAFDCQIFLLFSDKCLAIAPKKFHHFKSIIQPSRTMESTLRELIVHIRLRFEVSWKTDHSVSFQNERNAFDCQISFLF